MQCSDVLELSCRADKGSLLPDTPVVVSRLNAISIADLAENNEENHFKTLILFRNAYSLPVYRKLLGFMADEVEKRLVEGTILSPAKLHAWIVTVLQRLAKVETRGGRREEVFAATLRVNLKLAVAQIMGQNCQFVELWKLEELQIPVESGNEINWKDVVLGMKSRATVLVQSTRRPVTYIAVLSTCFTKNIGTGVGRIYDCFIVEASSDYRKITYLEWELGDINDTLAEL